MVHVGGLRLRCNHAGNMSGSARPDRPTRPVKVPRARRNHDTMMISFTRFGQRSQVSKCRKPLAVGLIVTQKCTHVTSGRPLARLFHTIHKGSAEVLDSRPGCLRSIQTNLAIPTRLGQRGVPIGKSCSWIPNPSRLHVRAWRADSSGDSRCQFHCGLAVHVARDPFSDRARVHRQVPECPTLRLCGPIHETRRGRARWATNAKMSSAGLAAKVNVSGSTVHAADRTPLVTTRVAKAPVA